MDDVPIIDNMAALIVRYRLAALQRDDWCGAQKTFEPIIKDAHTQAMTDQPRRYGIEYAPQDEPARGSDRDDLFLKIGSAAFG